jgi:hypothetical protein
MRLQILGKRDLLVQTKRKSVGVVTFHMIFATDVIGEIYG